MDTEVISILMSDLVKKTKTEDSDTVIMLPSVTVGQIVFNTFLFLVSEGSEHAVLSHYLHVVTLQ